MPDIELSEVSSSLKVALPSNAQCNNLSAFETAVALFAVCKEVHGYLT